MKRILLSLLLALFYISQTQVWVIYADSQQKISASKDAWTTAINAIDTIIDKSITRLDKKIKSEEKSENLQKKHTEIQEYLEEVKNDIAWEKSTRDIEEKVDEAKKVVVLKVVAGITQFEDATQNIPNDIAGTYRERKNAAIALKDSLETRSWDYSIIVKTKYSKSKLKDTFALFDDDTKIEYLYDEGDSTYFEVFLREDSIFRQEMLEDIESWILPEKFLWVKIVLPEVFSISEVSLEWEDISQTWWVERYAAFRYLDEESVQASKKIKVAVVDTWIDYTHPDLKQRVNREIWKDFVNDDDDAYDDQWHGTHVAGTIAASLNNSWIIWVNPYVELIPLKICTSTWFCPSYAVIRALDYAKNQDIDIINMSLGGRWNPDDHVICSSISSVVESWLIVVAASWNSNIDTSNFVPGWCDKAISVAAVNQSQVRAPFSNYGNKVAVSAPWVDVYSTYPVDKGSYKKLSGTSMAAPHIVGLISLMMSYNSDITVWEILSAFSQFPIAVSTISSKSIANAVDVESLMLSFQKQEIWEEEKVTWEPGKEEVDESGVISQDTNKVDFVSEEILLWDTNISSEISWNIHKEEAPIDENEWVNISSIDIWDENWEIIVNENRESVTETISEVLVEGMYSSIGNKSYDSSWKLLDGNTQINSWEEPSEIETLYIEEDFDIYNLPQREESDTENTQIWEENEESWVEINSWENQEIQDLLIDWAQPEVRINSNEEELWEEFDIDEFTPIQNQNNEDIFLDEFGNESALPDVWDDFIDDEMYDDSEEIYQDGWSIETPTDLQEEFDGEDSVSDDEEITGEWEEYTPWEEGEEDSLGIQNTFSCNIFVWQTCRLRIYKSYYYSFTKENPEVSSHRSYKRSLYITWNTLWESTYRLYRNGKLYHTIYVSVWEKTPVIKEMTMYEWQVKHLWSYRYSSPSWDVWDIWRYYKLGRSWYFQAYKAWEVDVFFLHLWRRSYMDDIHYKITVLPLPVPQEHNIEFIWWYGRAQIHLPDDLSLYDITYEGPRIFDDLQKKENSFYMKVVRVWEVKIILKDKSSKFVRHIIYVSSIPEYRDYTIYVSDKVEVPYHRYSRLYSQNGWIVGTYTRWSEGYIKWMTPWNIEVHLHDKRYGLRSVFNITVLPKPEPIEILCEITVWEECYFSGMKRTGQYLSESNRWMTRINWNKSSIRVDGEASGTAKIHIRSPIWDYISHTLIIKVHAKPPREKVFTTIVWWEWESNGYLDRWDYSFWVSKSWIVELSRKWYWDGRDKLIIKWVSPWELDIYIYELWDHTMTLKTTILPISPITFSQNPIIVWEGKEIFMNTTGWYPPYTISNRKDEYADLHIDKHTWEIEVEWEKESVIYGQVEDRYGQKSSFKVEVTKTHIETDVESMTLSPWETAYINITDFNRALHGFFRSTNNAKIFRETWMEDDTPHYRVKVEAIYSWKVVVYFKDYQEPRNQEKVIPITITWDVQNPDFKEFRHPDAIDNCVEDNSWDLKDGLCGDPKEKEEVVEEEWIVEWDAEWELDNLLQSLLGEFWIWSIQENNVEVNSSFILSKTQKNKIDTSIKKLIEKKWESSIMRLKSVIPYLKKKYSSFEEWVILDYIWASIEKQTEFKIINISTNINNWNIWWLEFKVSENLQWKVSAIGVQYIDWSWNLQKTELAIQKDGRYIVAYSADSCSWCKDLKPYYLLTGKTDVFISNTWVAEVYIANSALNQFVNRLRLVWNWWGYDKEYHKIKYTIVDVKESVEKLWKDISINFILQTIAYSTSRQIETSLINISTLPVAGHMLDKFLNWPAWNDSYDTYHWISEKIYASEKYDKILQDIPIDYDFSKIQEWWIVEFNSSSNKFPQVFTSFDKLDLFMAIASFNYSISVLRKEGKLYSIVKISDEYDFEPNNYWEGVSQTLNYWWNYHEKNLKGEPYKWKSIIIKPLHND